MITNKDILALSEELEQIEDFRDSSKVIYPISEIIFTVLFGIMMGHKSWYEFEESANLNLPWLRHFYKFSNGIASHDTMNRVFKVLDTSVLESILIRTGFFEKPKPEKDTAKIKDNAN